MLLTSTDSVSNLCKLSFLFLFLGNNQRWSPQGCPWPRARPLEHILKSLALASKVEFFALASKPQVLENCPVLGSRTAHFLNCYNFVVRVKKIFGEFFFWISPEKNF